ncbi:Glucan 1,3-beta-glucosidase [Smittium mucronatum]|uniref:glucan endo-1,3-beta-D-glucosidase n=1 Tax=Smittium mucronatum TaxID=133383 RepID=A0A1R0GRQ3_9FUNG|nr:Glucan 1,3-beta-glucosidase [Smittium mucronatum]
MRFSFITFLVGVVSAQNTFNALNYNPKRADGSCANVDQVKTDLANLSPYTNTLRIYSAIDCQQGEAVLRAMQGTSWKLYLGVWVDSNDATYQAELAEVQRLSTVFDFKQNVVSVIVGSESIYRGEQTSAQIASKVASMKTSLSGLGLSSIPVTAAETWPYTDSTLVSSVDFVMVNGFPYWEGVTIDQAVDTMFTHVNSIKAISQGKKVVVGETGWPSAGDNFGASVASLDNAFAYMTGFICRSRAEGLDYLWFQAFDAPWASAGQSNQVESNFGILLSDYKTPKYPGSQWFACGTTSSSSSIASSASSTLSASSSSASSSDSSSAASPSASSSAASPSASSSAAASPSVTSSPFSSLPASATSTGSSTISTSSMQTTISTAPSAFVSSSSQMTTASVSPSAVPSMTSYSSSSVTIAGGKCSVASTRYRRKCSVAPTRTEGKCVAITPLN